MALRNRMAGVAAAAFLLSAPHTAAAAGAPAPAPFRISEASYLIPVPAGLCLPEGKVAAISQMTSAADTANVTVLDFWTCGAAETAGNHYVLLKVPKTVLLATVEKEDALKSLEGVMTAPDAPQFDKTIDQSAKQEIDKVTGQETKVESNFGYVGRDEDCVYMAGLVSIGLAATGKTKAGKVAICMTVVGHKLMTVNVYDFGGDGKVPVLLEEAHTLARSIRPADPAH